MGEQGQRRRNETGGVAKVYVAYKTELDPNNRQKTYFGRCAGASRFVYNWGLAEWVRQYEAGEKPSAYGLRKQFNAAKDEFCPWVREVPYAVTESAFANLGIAFDNFFRRVKSGADKPGYPKFKKRGGGSSFQVKSTKVFVDRVRITGVGNVRLKERGYIPVGASKYGVYATISERAGRWFISVLVEVEDTEVPAATGTPIGIDLGLWRFGNVRKLVDHERVFAPCTRGGLVINYLKSVCHGPVGIATADEWLRYNALLSCKAGILLALVRADLNDEEAARFRAEAEELGRALNALPPVIQRPVTKT